MSGTVDLPFTMRRDATPLRRQKNGSMPFMLKTFAILLSATALTGAGAAIAQTAPMQPAPHRRPAVPAAPATATPVATGNIVQILAATPDRSTLAKLVATAGLTADLSGPGPFTVFAPSNEAFSRMPRARSTR